MFVAEGITKRSLVLLSDGELRELGFRMGERKILLNWIKRQQEVSTTVPSLPTLVPASVAISATASTSAAAPSVSSPQTPTADTRSRQPRLFKV